MSNSTFEEPYRLIRDCEIGKAKMVSSGGNPRGFLRKTQRSRRNLANGNSRRRATHSEPFWFIIGRPVLQGAFKRNRSYKFEFRLRSFQGGSWRVLFAASGGRHRAHVDRQSGNRAMARANRGNIQRRAVGRPAARVGCEALLNVGSAYASPSTGPSV